MKAQIFYLDSQQALGEKIASLLGQYVYKNIQVDLLVISHDYLSRGGSHIAQSYLNFLKSSLISVDDFRITVEETNGTWWYMGYGGYGIHDLKVRGHAMTSIFPAVAIMNRMVMLPQGIREAFDPSREFSFFPKPLDLQGVLLVDFQNDNALPEGVRQVGAQLKTEIAKLCRRYMFVNKILSPNYDELARMLKIDRNFFEQHHDEIFPPAVKLTPRIISGPAQLAKQSQVVLEIQNESEGALGTVCVQVRAPSGALTAPVAQYLDFSADNAQLQEIQFDVSPSTHPYCPLEVLFVPNEASPSYTPFPIPVILDVVKK